MQYSDRVIVFSGDAVSEPMDVAELTVDRLGQMIGGKFGDRHQELSVSS
jgi:simple sugar transport system ATP-binding protein